LEQRGEPVAKQRVVVRDDDSERRRSHGRAAGVA
jgi:hypothetical protein